MAYSLVLTKSAIKELDNLPDRQRKNIVDHLKQIEADPRLFGSQKLSGRNEYKLRVGNFRIIYGIDDGSHQITVYLIDDRKHVYRKLRRM